MKQTDLYHHFEKIENHQSSDFRIRSIMNLILPYLESGNLILDAGCGTCAQLTHLLKMGHMIEGIEPSEEILRIGKKYLKKEGCSTNLVKNTRITHHSIEKSDHYEQMICLDVIEHIENDLEAIYSMYQMLKKGGAVINSSCNSLSLWRKRQKNGPLSPLYEKRSGV